MEHTSQDYELNVPAIAMLTALTRLELTRFSQPVEALQSLGDLGLQELVLLGCSGLPEALFAHGSFTSLQRIHIAERRVLPSLADFQRDLQTPSSRGYLPAHRLCRLGATVTSLPSLVQLSGRCPLFAVGMPDSIETRGWKEGTYPRASMSDYDLCLPKIYMWVRSL